MYAFICVLYVCMYACVLSSDQDTAMTCDVYCVYMYVCEYVCMHSYMCVYVYMYACVLSCNHDTAMTCDVYCVYMYVCEYVYMCVCVYVLYARQITIH